MCANSPPKLPRRCVDDAEEDNEEIATSAASCCDTTITGTTTTTSKVARKSVHFAPPGFYRSHRRLLNPDSIKAHLYDLYDDVNSNVNTKSRECWKAFYEKYHTPSFVQVRPSGNLIDASGFIDMFCCDEIVMINFELVGVDSVRILAGGMVAVVTYRVDQTFSFRGELQEDRVVYTCILEEVDGVIRIQHEHRSSGSPIPSKQTDRWAEHSTTSKIDSACSSDASLDHSLREHKRSSTTTMRSGN